MSSRLVAVIAIAFVVHVTSPASASAQHATMPGMKTEPATSSTAPSMNGPLGISIDRMGSGTTWIPEEAPLPSRTRRIGGWDLMGHGFVFAQYDHQSGKRGGDQLGSLNWAMLMASRNISGGRFQARTMLSLDPATVTSKGYPLLLQSGESYRGEALHDRQHPHDFLMEVGALYQRAFNERVGWSVYAAPSGEPALGPVAFMHRPSAMDNPSAPISHHWQDATHVSFGVVTAGLFGKTWQLEGSHFNGREPDEHRWNFDRIKLDSWSGRVTANPSASWSISAGTGYMKSPEALQPNEPMHRYTVSVLHGVKIGDDGQSATAVIWGANRHGSAGLSHSVLLENETILDKKNTVFARSELVQKSRDDLSFDGESTVPGAGKFFNVGTVQIGAVREIRRVRFATIGLGLAGTLNVLPQSLTVAYGSRAPIGTMIFVRLRPFHSAMQMDKAMDMDNM